MTFKYDNNNIFAKILRKEIPANFIFENEGAVAFFDIAPKAKTHILLLPKGEYVCSEDFYKNASSEEIRFFYDALNHLIETYNLTSQKSEGGFRLISNAGKNAHQEVPHYHLHILGGEVLTSMI